MKGGRLALAAGDAPMLTVLVSDVPPQQLDCLASGPTVPDPTTVAECRRLLSRYSLNQALPELIRTYFASTLLAETPKPEDLKSRLCVLLDSDDLAVAAGQHARALGYHVVLDNTCDDWPYEEAANYLLDRVRVLRAQHERLCLISAGEVTVPVPTFLEPGVSHLGGRNQHFALYIASLFKTSDQTCVALSAGSDGIDGNSFAAGGVVGTSTLQTKKKLQEAMQALRHFDSSTFLTSCDATVITGSTGNNLRDMRILLAESV